MEEKKLNLKGTIEREKFKSLILDLESLKMIEHKKAQRIIKELQYIDDYYISASGCLCARMGLYSLDWYFDFIEELDLEAKRLSCFSYTANGEYYSIDWCEHDLIIVIKPPYSQTRETIN